MSVREANEYIKTYFSRTVFVTPPPRVSTIFIIIFLRGNDVWRFFADTETYVPPQLIVSSASD